MLVPVVVCEAHHGSGNRAKGKCRSVMKVMKGVMKGDQADIP